MASMLKKINWPFCIIALTMLIFGILMISAPFCIKHHTDLLDPKPNWREIDREPGLAETALRSYCSTGLFSTSDTFWPGIVVCIHISILNYPVFFEDVLDVPI